MSLTTTRTYLSTDSGAPVVNGQAGSFIAVIKACLIGVAGVAYGSKPAVGGWSIEFEDPSTHRLVLRNSMAHGGLGCCVLITNASNAVVMECGSDWDAVNEVVLNAVVGRSFTVSNTTDSTAREWGVFADERTFYCATKPNTANLNAAGIRGAGDYESFWAGDVCAYFVMVGDTTWNSARRVSAGTSAISNVNSGVYVGGRNSNFGALQCAFFACFGSASPGGEFSGGWSASNSLPSVNPPNGVIFTAPAYVRVGANNEVSGRMRLLHVCDHVRNTGGLIEFLTGMETSAGIPLAQIRTQTNVNTNLHTPLFVEVE